MGVDPPALTGSLGWVAAVLYPLAALWAGGHALLHARDPRSAWGWIAVCLLFPLAGALLYFFFGINRVRRRARLLLDPSSEASRADARQRLPPLPQNLQALMRVGDSLTHRPAEAGNRLEPLHNGDAAYPEMLAAINGARDSVWLASYIFRNDRTGRQFMTALAEAAQRGVTVRVLVDGVGALYGMSFPVFWLRRRGVRAARFLPPRLLPPMLHINLRNHRKLLVVDGELAFTGGMNIAEYHRVADTQARHTVADVHFRVEGPVVDQLAQAFGEDWRMAAGESLELPARAPIIAGGNVARLITDGPDDDLDKLAFVLLGAVTAAQERVRIMTPYFLPSPELRAALETAALRGVIVSVVLPLRSNMRFVDWAARHSLQALLAAGVRVHLQPPPFAHSKLFVVDDHYALIGTANIDPRSLRLNFELGVECYDRPLARRLNAHFDGVEACATRLLAADLDARRLPARLRDAFFWLFSSYL